MSLFHVTDEDFEEKVIGSQKTVIVDFFANWCGPCKMIAPIVAEIAEEKEGLIKVGKIDVDEQAELALKYGIVSIPTLLLFDDGKVMEKKVGYCDKDELLEIL